MSGLSSPRQIARELALLSLPQMPKKAEKLNKIELDRIIIESIKSLRLNIEESIEIAAAEVQRSNERILSSQTRASNLDAARQMLQEAVESMSGAINRLGHALELPEFITLANHKDVRHYSITLLITVNEHRTEIDEILKTVMVDWQLSRLPKIDRDILRIAVAEMKYLDFNINQLAIPINEAVELAKRYSDDEGRKFINGVLRRVVTYLQQETTDRDLATTDV